MNNKLRYNLNLASHPLRNRRMFFMLLIVLGAAFLCLSAWDCFTFLKYKNKNSEISAEIGSRNAVMRELRREETRMVTQMQDLNIKYKKKIDLINSFIVRKSFSWIDFLTALESSLPSSSFIVSMAPSFKGGSRIEIRFRVATPDLDELIEFISQLESQGFKDLRVMREAPGRNRYLISEISLSYEKTA
jgi:cell division protein FtsB